MDSTSWFCRAQRASRWPVAMVVGAAALAGCGVAVTSGDSDDSALRSVEITTVDDGDQVDAPSGATSDGQSLVVETQGGVDGEETVEAGEGRATASGDSFTVVFHGGTADELPVDIDLPGGWSPDGADTFTDGASSITLSSGCADCDAPGGYNDFFPEDVDLESEDLGFGFGFDEDGTVHESLYGFGAEGDWLGQVALYLEGAPNFVGCVVNTVDEATMETLIDLCESVSIGWPAELVEAAMEAMTFTFDSDESADSDAEATEIVETITEAAAATVANPAPGLVRRDVVLELGDGARAVNIGLPDDATTGEGFVGVDISFDATSIFTEVNLSSICDGVCQPKDWGSALNSSDGYLTGRRQSMETIDNDWPIDSGWLLSGSGGFDAYTIVVARWDDASDQFMLCEASLDEDDLALTELFLGVCLSAQPSWF